MSWGSEIYSWYMSEKILNFFNDEYVRFHVHTIVSFFLIVVSGILISLFLAHIMHILLHL